MRILVGTSGWSYKHWKGAFYPADLAADDMLRYYATRLPTVEINNTFYRTPKESVLMDWSAQVSGEFRFVLKAPRRITHINRLSDADDSLAYFMRIANVLGDRLGPTLFQCPPTLRKNMELLHGVSRQGAAHLAGRLEFRHDSWHDDEVYDALRAHDIALVCVDEDEGTDAVGAHRVVGLSPPAQDRVHRPGARRLGRAVRGQPWDEACVFLKHDEETTAGPDAAVRLAGMV